MTTVSQEEDISASEMLQMLMNELVGGMDKCVQFSNSSTENTDVYKILRGITTAVQYTQQRIAVGDV